MDYNSLFNPIHSENIAKVFLFFTDEAFSSCKSSKDKENLLISYTHQINDLIHTLSANYIWSASPFHVKYVNLWKYPNRGGKERDLHNGFLFCEFHFEECIDDEWFVVSILKSITNQFHFVAGHIEDIDGNFILIECSSVLPKWLTPETSTNKCFFYHGHYLILPPTDESPTIQQSLSLLPTLSIQPSSIDDSITRRIQQIYDHQHFKIHHAYVYLPQSLALLLSTYPQLISYICQYYFEATPGELKEAQKHTFHNPIECVVSIPYSLYCILQSYKWTNPNKDVELETLATHRKRILSEQEHEQLSREIDIGHKLALGFEIFMTSYHKQDSNLDDDFSHSSILSPKDLFPDIDILLENQEQLIKTAPLQMVDDSKPEDLHWLEIDEKSFDEFLESNQVQLSDHELYEIIGIEPQSFYHSSCLERDSEEELNVEDAEKILGSIKTFMKSESSFQGVETLPETDDDSDSDSSFEFTVDMDKVKQIIQGIPSSSDSSSDSEDELHTIIRTIDQSNNPSSMPQKLEGSLERDYNVLSNVLQSIDMQEQGTGPATTILNDMGIHINKK